MVFFRADSTILFVAARDPGMGRNQKNLAAPGEAGAFYLDNETGRTYPLIRQSGWDGPATGGFGPRYVSSLRRRFRLYFPGVQNWRTVSSLRLVEGNCTGSGCWHYPSIRLTDR